MSPENEQGNTAGACGEKQALPLFSYPFSHEKEI
jgi:hypothetical protein